MKKRLKGILLLLTVAVLAAVLFFNKNARYEHLVEDIYQCVAEIKYARAFMECEEAVSLFPERMEAYAAYAYLRYAEGDYAEAEKKLLEGLKIARDRYAEEGIVTEGAEMLTLTLAGYYCEWNRTEDACSLIRNMPESLLGSAAYEYLEQLTGSRTELETDYVIVWKDAGLETMIRKLLEMPEGDIMASQVWYLDSIEIWGNEIVTGENAVTAYDRNGFYLNGRYLSEKGSIESLEDLVHFPNLESISINYQNHLQISFFTENETMTRLRKLSLVGNDISDIRPLMWTTRLTTLNLDYNNISDFLWISRLYGLNYLSAKGNKAFYSTELYESMESLDYLDISEMEHYDTERVSDIPNLTALVIDYGDDLTFIAFCESLQKLTIKTDAAGMYNVERVNGLTELTLTLTEKASLSGISGLRFLERLNIFNESGECIDLSPVADMENLTALTIGTGDFEGYAAIARNSSIQSVTVPYGESEKYDAVSAYFPKEFISRAAMADLLP